MPLAVPVATSTILPHAGPEWMESGRGARAVDESVGVGRADHASPARHMTELRCKGACGGTPRALARDEGW